MLDWVFKYLVPSAFDLNMSEMVSLCNGLVCLIEHTNRSNTDDAIYLWNPNITKWEMLIGALRAIVNNSFKENFDTTLMENAKNYQNINFFPP